jgi:hypothetical protein
MDDLPALTLALLVLWIAANNHHVAVTLDDAALGAAHLDGC